MAKAGGNMHSPADDSTPKFGGVPPHPPADQHHGMVNQNEQHGEPSHMVAHQSHVPQNLTHLPGQLGFIIFYNHICILFVPHLCVGFLFLILYPASASSSATPPFIHTQLCHTPSFTTPSFTHNLAHHLSHTIFAVLAHHLVDSGTLRGRRGNW